jgi:hypothetical protein
MILIIIASDLAAVFPDYTDTFEIDLKESLRILERYPAPDEIRNADPGELLALMDTGNGHYHMDEAVKLKLIAENLIKTLVREKCMLTVSKWMPAY